MIQGIIKKLSNYGVSEQSGTPWISGVIESKEGELISIVAFRDEALKLSAFQVGDEIKCAGRKNKGEDSFTVAFTEKVLNRARAIQEMTEEGHENARRELISKLPRDDHRLGDIEAVMEFYGALEVTKELRELGIHLGKTGKYRGWLEAKLSKMKERGLF